MGFSKSTGPTKKQLAPYGGKPKKPPSFNIPGDKNFGEVGSRAMATAAMKGRPPPKTKLPKVKGPARKDAKRQFGKVPGAKVF